ncbi:MAG: LytR C-terminal domain-containing protein [Actinomycetota bacterium]|nr:LytR C-terminal domain-containing protein [Actinomycetota bacterium]
MTAPQTSRRSLDPSVRGVLVLAVVVVVGVLLLAKASPSSSTTVASREHPGPTLPTTTPPTSTTRPTPSTPTTLGAVHPASQVKVLVMNGTGGRIPMAAGLNATKLKAKGFNTLAPANAVTRPTSAVYFVPGYQADAVAVGAVLGIPASSAVPVPTPLPQSPDASKANVIVLLGQDTHA